MNNARSVLLFSNREEIVSVMGQSNRDDLSLNFLSRVNWLLHYNKSSKEFEEVNNSFKMTKLSGGEIFVVYDGGLEDDLELDGSRLNILRGINKKSSKVHIAFHQKPIKKKKDQLRQIFPNCTEETPLPKHESSFDGYIYSQVYNSLYNLYQGANQQVEFFDNQVSNVDEMIDVIFERADKTKDANLYLQYLLCCMSKETINANSDIINKMDIFPEKNRSEIGAQLIIMEKATDFKNSDYQNAFMKLCRILDEIT